MYFSCYADRLAAFKATLFSPSDLVISGVDRGVWPKLLHRSKKFPLYRWVCPSLVHVKQMLDFFLFKRPIFLSNSRLGRSPKVNSWKLLWQNFYRPDALPVTQPTVSNSVATNLKNLEYSGISLEYSGNSQGILCNRREKL